MSELNLPDPGIIDLEDIPPAIAQLAALQGALAARLILERRQPEIQEDDELVTVHQAAKLLGVKKSWLYSRANNLPFVRRMSRKGLRFSRRGINAWITRKR